MSEERFWMSRTPDELKRYLEDEEARSQAIFRQMMAHSGEYINALGLTERHLELMQSIQGRAGIYPTQEDKANTALLRVKVDGEIVSIIATHLSTHEYGGKGWETVLVALSDDTESNETSRLGDTMVTTIPEETHAKIVEGIRKNNNLDSAADELFGHILPKG